MRMPDGKIKTANVVVIGGGPAGVATIGKLVANSRVRSITVVDPIAPGHGIVFGELCAADPSLMCNSTVGVTMIDIGQPDGFLDFLLDKGWPIGREEHVPRYLFGEFCRDRFLTYARAAQSNGIELNHKAARANLVHREAGQYRVELDDGEMLKATHVVLCTGIGDRSVVPAILAAYADHPRFLLGTYPVSRLRELPAGAHVLVIGLRSSGQDAMVALTKSGHSVVMTSPSGRLSAVRDTLRLPTTTLMDNAALLALDTADPGFEDRAVKIILAGIENAGDGLPVLRQMLGGELSVVDRLKQETAIAEAGLCRWADLTFDIINTLNDAVAPWDSETRKRIMGRAYEYLTRYVNALPMLYAKRLLSAIAAGSTRMSEVYIGKIVPEGEGWSATWRDGAIEHFDYIVAANGFHFPRFPLRGPDAIQVATGGDLMPGDSLADIMIDLSVRFAPEQPSERIWVVGAATNNRFPFAHIIWIGAQNSQAVSDAIALEETRERSAPMHHHVN